MNEFGEDSDHESKYIPEFNSEDSPTATVIPEASRKRYEVAYRAFMDWRHETNQSDSFDENVFIDYFSYLSKKYKPSTLWPQYSMLRSTLAIKHNVDILRYMKLRIYLRKRMKGYVPKKTKMFTSEEISRFLNEASDEEYLLTKAALVIGVSGACKRSELCKLRLSHMEDLGSVLSVKFNDANYPRTFIVTGRFYEIYKNYARLRPTNLGDDRFFLNYQRGKCTRQAVGINKFGQMPKQIATFLNLPHPEQYTGHCFRRSKNISINSDSLNHNSMHDGSSDDYDDDSMCSKDIEESIFQPNIEIDTDPLEHMENKSNFNDSDTSNIQSSITKLLQSVTRGLLNNSTNGSLNIENIMMDPGNIKVEADDCNMNENDTASTSTQNNVDFGRSEERRDNKSSCSEHCCKCRPINIHITNMIFKLN